MSIERSLSGAERPWLSDDKQGQSKKKKPQAVAAAQGSRGTITHRMGELLWIILAPDMAYRQKKVM